ncbi:MAG: hypothetical protein KC766_13285 [Myxococcales bacterium]|nr:hypothetical protein [Myxococcales bacterium]
MEEKPETSRRSPVPSTLETLRLEPEQARRLALESTSDALPTNPLGHPPPTLEQANVSPGQEIGRRRQATTRPPPRGERSTATPSVSPLKHLLEGQGEWKELPSEPKIRVEDEATRPDLRAVRRPIRIARDAGFDEDQPTQPARHLSRRTRTPSERRPPADPRLLLVGFPEGLELAICEGLKRQSIRVVVGSPAVLSQALLQRVDFLVLFGDARSVETQGCLGRVSRLRLPDLGGVVLVSEDASLPARVLALRHGATSVIPRTASLGLLVERIAHVAWGTELSDEQACEREATVDELMGTLAEELENRLRAPGESSDPGGATRLVFSAARGLPRLIDDMVSRVGADIERVEHWDYELDAQGSRAWLDDESRTLRGARVALLDDDAMRADAVAHELRERGAHVLVVGSQLAELAWSRLARFDPMLLVFGSERDADWQKRLSLRLESDPSLWAIACVGVDLAALWQETESFPTVEPVVRELNRVLQRQHSALERLRVGEELTLQGLGFALGQLMRALAAEATCRLEVDGEERRFRVWLADGVLVGATEARAGDDATRLSEGLVALTRLLECREARLRVVPALVSVGPPNLITPVDVALGQACAELRRTLLPQPRVAAVPARSTPPHPQPLVEDVQLDGSPSEQPELGGLRPAIDPAQVRPRRRGSAWTWLLVGLPSLGLGALGLTLLLRTPSPAPMKARVAATPAVLDTPRQQTAPQSKLPSGAVRKKTPRVDLEAKLEQARGETFSVRGKPTQDCGPAEVTTSAGQAIAQARRALMSGKLEAATLAYCKAVARVPEDAQLMTELARVFLQRGAGEQAVKWAKRAYELSPKTLNQVLLGDALALDGQFGEAKRAWSEAWKIRSRSTLAAIASAHFHTANRAAAQRDFAKAERFLRRVALLDKERADAPLALARVLMEVSEKQGAARYAEAEAWALRAAALARPREPADEWQESLRLLADAARARGEIALAQEAATLLAR